MTRLLRVVRARAVDMRAADGGDRGSAPIEMAITGLCAIALIALLVIGGRVAIASSSMSDVASAAARDASLSSPLDPEATVQARAVAAARDALATEIDCGPLTVTVDLAARIASVGQPGTVTATVTCDLHYATIRFPGLPTTATITETAVSPTDPYRDRP